MKSISKSSLNKFRKGEIIQYMRNVTKVYQGYDTKVLNLESHITPLVTATDELSDIYKRRPDSDLTSGLRMLDNERMLKLRGLKMYLNVQSRFLDNDQKEAARILINNYDDHITNGTASSPQEKTANIIALLNNWKQDADLAAAVQSLAMQPMIDKLVEVNEGFDAKHVNRSLKDKIQSLTLEKRAKLVDLYMALLSHTEAYSIVSEQKETYKTILNEVSLVHKNYKNPVKLRYAQKAKDKPAETSSEGTNTTSDPVL